MRRFVLKRYWWFEMWCVTRAVALLQSRPIGLMNKYQLSFHTVVLFYFTKRSARTVLQLTTSATTATTLTSLRWLFSGVLSTKTIVSSFLFLPCCSSLCAFCCLLSFALFLILFYLINAAFSGFASLLVVVYMRLVLFLTSIANIFVVELFLYYIHFDRYVLTTPQTSHTVCCTFVVDVCDILANILSDFQQYLPSIVNTFYRTVFMYHNFSLAT